MRVLHVDSGREFRGGQRQALLLMRGLRERGHEGILLARAGTPIASAARESGFLVHDATLGNLRADSKTVEVVHAHDARSHTLAAIASKRPVVVSRRVAFPVKRGWFSRWKYRQPARYLAVSEFVARELLEAGVPREKIDVVYDGFERMGEVAPAEGFRIVALATNDPAKGRRLIEQGAALAGVDVTFSDDLARDLPGASVFIYGTQSEGLGSAALLAMSLAIPVIASRVGGLPEIVEEGGTGLLAENEAPAFADAIKRLRDDSGLRLRLGANARARVERDFRADKMVEQTIAAYQRTLHG